MRAAHPPPPPLSGESGSSGKVWARHPLCAVSAANPLFQRGLSCHFVMDRPVGETTRAI